MTQNQTKQPAHITVYSSPALDRPDQLLEYTSRYLRTTSQLEGDASTVESSWIVSLGPGEIKEHVEESIRRIQEQKPSSK